MLCTNCGATNPDGAKICQSCKQPLSAVWQSPKSELLADGALEEEMEYAGFWERFAALFLDGLVLWIVMMVFSFILGLLLAVARPGPGAGMSFGVIFGAYVVPLLLSAAYYVSMESGERGATFGKRALKLRVVSLEGERISVGRALGRWAAHGLSNITMLIGYLIQPFTARKQALHDMVSGTVVVKTEKSSSTLAIVIVALFFGIVVIGGILAAIAIPAYQDYIVKAKTAQAEAVGRLATRAVEDYAAQTGKIPASLAQTGIQLPALPNVSAINVNPENGEVQVVFNSSMGRALADKALVFDASRGADGKIVWTCSGPDIPPRMLPPDCR